MSFQMTAATTKGGVAFHDGRAWPSESLPRHESHSAYLIWVRRYIAHIYVITLDARGCPKLGRPRKFFRDVPSWIATELYLVFGRKWTGSKLSWLRTKMSVTERVPRFRATSYTESVQQLWPWKSWVPSLGMQMCSKMSWSKGYPQNWGNPWRCIQNWTELSAT